MALFLQIVFGFFVAMILMLFVLYWLIKWKIRSLGLSLSENLNALAANAAGAGIPPMRIELEEIDDVEWESADRVQALETPLRENGFQHIADYEVDMNATVHMRAFTHPDHFAYAVIYEVEPIGVWLDIFTRYNDGRDCTFSSGRHSGMDYPSDKSVHNLPDVTAGKLLTRFLAERPDGEMLPCPAEDFASIFESEHAAEMDWRAARGGPTEREIRRSMEVWGDPGNEIDDETVTLIQEQWREHFNEFWEDELRKNYLSSSDMDALEWERVRDRLVFVHDRLSAGELVDFFEPIVYQLTYGDEDEDDFDDDDDLDNDDDRAEQRLAELRAVAEQNTPRVAFVQINETLPADLRFERRGEVNHPLTAEVWILAEGVQQ